MANDAIEIWDRAPVGHPWRAPAIASFLAGAFLLLLVFGHVLRYPASVQRMDGQAIDAQRQTNQAFRDQLDRLTKATGNQCQAALGADPRGAVLPVLPPLPARTLVPGPGRNSEAITLADLLEKATVLILTGDGLGSGFFISDRHIVTNHHVVANTGEVRAGSRSLGGFVPARVLAVGSGAERGTQDLAVLEVAPASGTAALRLGVVPERLEPLTAAGYPGAVLETVKGASPPALPEANFTQGILTSRQVQAPAGIGTIIHTAQIGHGNSGGPLVDAGGCAVGVNSWLSIDAEERVVFSTFFQALDVGELRKFLDAHNLGYSAADGTCRSAQSPEPGSGGSTTPSPSGRTQAAPGRP